MVISERMAGQRVTSQRRLLLDIIREAEGHLGADELFRQAKEREPRISLSTIYRNLQLFKELGLVDERHFNESHHHYEVKGPMEHHHLVCLGCGQVIEFESSLMAGARGRIEKEHQFEVSAAHIYLEGYCSDCRREANREEVERGGEMVEGKEEI